LVTRDQPAIEVTVTRKGVLATGRAPKDEKLTLAEGARTGDLLEACGIDPGGCIIVINGAVMVRGSELHDGDRVQLHPAQAGG
jgi:sulfur carrier protein ThiS